ncbi:biotin--[acetyl-CoA-carboxylase] ligase [Flaviaesturariibacter flavus]|uniref:biotin--[acetyl-CoA-carboxylase] ligase n=1 Tax=Flaviaesturariibacter flavus TaxID=2502780 RepID=UPI001404801D|nr:biotin--[acetyl-CoA-carboxylase] ligase [Flaviaesturariibacter flavus]
MSPGPKRIGTPFIELTQVDSTNNYATGLAHAGMAEHGTAVLAAHQTKGKGQRHKAWEGAPGANITMSLLLAPAGLGLQPPPVRLTAAGAFRFSMAVALGAQRFFARHAGEETFVKWPNDLYWRDRKAGGILIENILAGDQWKWAVAGLGININQTDFGPDAPRAVSLRQITGRQWDVRTLALELCASIEDSLNQLSASPDSVAADYHAVLFGRGEIVRLRKDSRVFAAEVLGVTEDGLLRVRHGVEEEFAVGEVEWVF